MTRIGSDARAVRSATGRQSPAAHGRLSRVGTLGLNARNDHIGLVNPVAAIRVVDDKLATKAALTAAGIPVAPTLGVLRDRRSLAAFVTALPGRCCVKPARGMGGDGVLVLAGRHQQGWLSPGGRRVGRRAVARHLRAVLDGEHSRAVSDAAMAEPMLVCDQRIDRLARAGLPDVRVVVDGDSPVMAMLRLPTADSGGRANLHAGGIGVALDLRTGVTTRALHGRDELQEHPDTGASLLGLAVPSWERLLVIARACGRAMGLGYAGVDLVVDRERGPLVLEVNARPGLEIQRVTGTPQVVRRGCPGASESSRPTMVGGLLARRPTPGRGVR